MKPLFAIIILFFIPKFHNFTTNAVNVEDSTLTVVFDTSTYTDGIVEASIYTEKDFLKKNKALQKERVAVSGAKTTVVFKNLAHGEYSVVSYLDKNSNNKLDRRTLLRTPKEPVAVSNMHKKKFRRPRFSESKINLTSDQTIQMTWVTY